MSLLTGVFPAFLCTSMLSSQCTVYSSLSARTRRVTELIVADRIASHVASPIVVSGNNSLPRS